MAIKQSPWALNQRTANRPQSAGAVHVTKFYHEFTAAAASGDIVDLGQLPAGAYIVDARLYTEGVFTGVTGDVGIMSGTPGSTDPARTCGNEIFAAADLAAAATAPANMALATAFKVTPADTHRSIGLKLAAAVPAAAGKKVWLVLEYAQ